MSRNQSHPLPRDLSLETIRDKTKLYIGRLFEVRRPGAPFVIVWGGSSPKAAAGRRSKEAPIETVNFFALNNDTYRNGTHRVQKPQ